MFNFDDYRQKMEYFLLEDEKTYLQRLLNVIQNQNNSIATE